MCKNFYYLCLSLEKNILFALRFFATQTDKSSYVFHKNISRVKHFFEKKRNSKYEIKEAPKFNFKKKFELYINMGDKKNRADIRYEFFSYEKDCLQIVEVCSFLLQKKKFVFYELEKNKILTSLKTLGNSMQYNLNKWKREEKNKIFCFERFEKIYFIQWVRKKLRNKVNTRILQQKQAAIEFVS